MRIAMLSPIAWRTPPRHYGPWESVVSLLTEGLVSRSYDVTLFATGDSETSGKLHAVCARGYEEDRSIMPKVWECLHIAELFEHAEDFDIIHNNFDFLAPDLYRPYQPPRSLPPFTAFHRPGFCRFTRNTTAKCSMFPSAMPTGRRILTISKPSITA